MNKLFIIGNGFDLAHGLKTKYSDFLLWYVNKSIKSLNDSGKRIFEDELITIDNKGYWFDQVNSLSALKDYLKKGRINFSCKNDLFEDIFDRSLDGNWVNIEYEYYMHLLNLYGNVERHRFLENFHLAVRQINNCLEAIKNELAKYLSIQHATTRIESISKHFQNELSNVPNDHQALSLVFNYTDTVDLYREGFKPSQHQIIYIHGKLGDEKNPIIFGYGDEMDSFYPKIEQLNLNEFLRNMKSFSYFKTDNYHKLHNFINNGRFDVCIMGHSCGISDRVLLSSIFCHKNCRYIRIYYYKNADGETDYFEKTQEISRHFPLDQKNRMRSMITSFENSQPLS